MHNNLDILSDEACTVPSVLFLPEWHNNVESVYMNSSILPGASTCKDSVLLTQTVWISGNGQGKDSASFIFHIPEICPVDIPKNYASGQRQGAYLQLREDWLRIIRSMGHFIDSYAQFHRELARDSGKSSLAIFKLRLFMRDCTSRQAISNNGQRTSLLAGLEPLSESEVDGTVFLSRRRRQMRSS